MKKLYVEPEMEIINVCSDVIVTSCPNEMECDEE